MLNTTTHITNASKMQARAMFALSLLKGEEVLFVFGVNFFSLVCYFLPFICVPLRRFPLVEMTLLEMKNSYSILACSKEAHFALVPVGSVAEQKFGTLCSPKARASRPIWVSVKSIYLLKALGTYSFLAFLRPSTATHLFGKRKRFERIFSKVSCNLQGW